METVGLIAPQCQEKKHEGKNGSGQRAHHPPQPRQLMRVWGKKKRIDNRRKNERKKQGVGPQPSYLDRSVASYDPHRSYGGPKLKPPPPTGGYFF